MLIFRLVQTLLLLLTVAYVGYLSWTLRQTRTDLQALQTTVTRLRHAHASAHRSDVRGATVGAEVRITTSRLDFVFRPAHLQIKAGTSVTWVNLTGSPHTVTSNHPGLFAKTVPPHRYAVLVFTHAGRFAYHCSYHPFMHGVVTVRG